MMARCDIQVLLDEPERVYFPGGEIKGVVQVETDTYCKCDALETIFEVHVSGKGYDNSHVLETNQEFVGSWSEQSRNDYPFSFRIPDDAQPYDGTLFNVHYRVRATADMPGRDAKGTALISVSTQPGNALDYQWDEEVVTKGRNAGCFYVPLVLFLFGAARMLTDQLEGLRVDPLAICVLTLGLLGVAAFGPEWLASKRLGPMQIGFERGSSGGYRVAEDKDIFVVVKAAAERSVTADLQVIERVVRGSRKNRTVQNHPVFESKVTFEKSEEGVFRGRLILPAEGTCPPTITYSKNKVIWQVSIHVDIPKSPDWTKNVMLEVTRKRSLS